MLLTFVLENVESDEGSAAVIFINSSLFLAEAAEAATAVTAVSENSAAEARRQQQLQQRRL